MSNVAKAKTVGIWVLSILMCLLLLLAGSVKFTGPVWPRMFAEWGYPDGFVYVIGAIEVGSALVLLIPSLAVYGAAVLAAVMLGAATTHLLHDQMWFMDAVFMMLFLLLAWVRWPAGGYLPRRYTAPSG